MHYTNEHESSHSLRVRLDMKKIDPVLADILRCDLQTLPEVQKVIAYPSTAGLTIRFSGDKKPALEKLSKLSQDDLVFVKGLMETPGEETYFDMEELKRRRIDPVLKKKMRKRILAEAAADVILPAPVQIAYHAYQLYRLEAFGKAPD